MLGNLHHPPGMSGRPLDYEELERDGTPARLAMPPLCRRNLQTNRGCEHSCPGVQRDGSCLCDKIRAGLRVIDIDRDGFWIAA